VQPALNVHANLTSAKHCKTCNSNQWTKAAGMHGPVSGVVSVTGALTYYPGYGYDVLC